ncbi:MAG: preprotein translocase subunit YajC [Bacillota bacterium]
MNNFVLMAAFFALIYFMMIRPQQKQQKKRREMLDSIRKGDKIITIGGILGTIKALRDDKVVIQVAKGVDITILKSAVGQVAENSEEPNDKPEALPEAEGEETQE